ncbi:hypothetical protein ISREJYDI_CDS0025 [Pseudomonas phage UNO-G1W1]|jgi:hypothetical protein|uniref:TMhelix containing protein n=1 Tax=Pseudomonas phage UNO-G1W1 TaxID=3136609 RepID=A0AAX4MVK5_9CAUD
MRLLGGLIVLVFLVFGFMCCWGFVEASIELFTTEFTNRAEYAMFWFMNVIVLLCGMMCFAVCPLIINEMD